MTKLEKYINKAKKALLKQRARGYCENIGSAELREAQCLIDYENYARDCKAFAAFEKWVYSL